MTSEERALFSARARVEACQYEVCYWRGVARRNLVGEMIAVGATLLWSLAFTFDPDTRLIGIGCAVVAVAWLVMVARLWWLLRRSE